MGSLVVSSSKRLLFTLSNVNGIKKPLKSRKNDSPPTSLPLYKASSFLPLPPIPAPISHSVHQFMPSMKLGKKLQLAKKAWKGFTSILQTKLHKVKRSKSIKKAKTRLNSTLPTILRRCPRRFSPPPRNIRTRTRIETRPTALRPRQDHKAFAPVFVDELFKVPVLAPAVKHVELPTTTSKVVGKAASSSPPVTTNGRKSPAAKAVMAAAPRASPAKATSAAQVGDLWGVDARAEQFILQFKEEMRLQRQRSFREYQEMLARGVM